MEVLSLDGGGGFPIICSLPDAFSHKCKAKPSGTQGSERFLVGAGGFEPPKSSTTDLQSAPFGHSGTLPYAIIWLPSQREGGAGRRTRTPDLLITNQLLYQLSYTSAVMTGNRMHYSRVCGFCQQVFLKKSKNFLSSKEKTCQHEENVV